MRLHQEPGAAQRELRDKDDELYVERSAPLTLGQVQTLPVPGSIELGAEELELHPADGHTPDGMAVMARWCGVLCVRRLPVTGRDTDGGGRPGRLPLDARAAERRWSRRPRRSCRATAHPTSRDGALRILDEDVDYLDALERGEERPALPKGRDTTRAAKAPRSQPGAFGLAGPGHRNRRCAGSSSPPSPSPSSRWRRSRRPRPRSASPTASRTAATSRRRSGPTSSASRTGASTPTAGTSQARWEASGRPR